MLVSARSRSAGRVVSRPLVLLLGAAGDWQEAIAGRLGISAGAIAVLDPRQSAEDRAREWADLIPSVDLVIYWLVSAAQEFELGAMMARRCPVVLGSPRSTDTTALEVAAAGLGSELRVCTGMDDTIVASRAILEAMRETE